MSNFDIFAVIAELRAKILRARIQKIYQMEKILIFRIKTDSGTINLLVETPNRIHITEYQRRKPKIPPNFCMKLRKTLKNMRILDVYQHNFDRVVVLKLGYIEPKTEGEPEDVVLFKLIFEFFDKGNVIFTDQNDIIKSALHYKTMRDRRIIPNRTFSLPITHGQNVMEITLKEFKNILQNAKKRFIPAIVNSLNVGPIYAQEICIRAGIDPNVPMSSFLEKSELIFSKLNDLMDSLKNKQFKPQIIYKNSELHAISPFDLLIYEQWKKKECKSLNEAADEFYSLQEETIESVEIQEEISKSQKKVQRLEKILNDQKEHVDNLIKKGEKYKTYGNLIYQNLGYIQQLFDFLNNSRKNNIAWEEIILKLQEKKAAGEEFAEIMEDIHPSGANIDLKIGDIKIQLDFTKSLTDIANDFYQQSKKMLRKAEGAKLAIKDTLKKLETARIEEPSESPKIAKPTKKRKKIWYEKFHWMLSSDGFLIIGGKDVKTNEIIVKKHMKDGDIFVHASFAGAPAVVIQSGGKQVNVPETTILEAAGLAISYSGAWKSGHSQADAFWVWGDQVTFSPPTGEYRKKGSFIIKGEKNVLKSIPAVIKIGFAIKDEQGYPIIAPKKHQKEVVFPVEICPGDLKSSILAKEIKTYWISSVKDAKIREKIKKMNLDELQSLIPAGMGKFYHPIQK